MAREHEPHGKVRSTALSTREMARVTYCVCLVLLAGLGAACVGAPQDKSSGDSAEKWLRIIASPEAPHEEKWQAVQELKQRGEEAVPGLLGVLSRDDAGNSRYYAIRALGYLRSRAATAALSRLLLDRGYPSRRYAAIALGQIGGPEAVLALTKALTDVPHVRTDALDALVKIDSQESRKVLEEYHFTSTVPAVRLQISCQPGPYQIGDKIAIAATLANTGSASVPLIMSENEPMFYLVFRRANGSFVEAVDTGLLEDKLESTITLRDLKPGASLRWQLVGKVTEWTRGEKDSGASASSGRPILTLDFGAVTFHIRRSGEFQVRVVVKQDEDLVKLVRRFPELSARSADITVKQVASNEVCFSVKAPDSHRREG